MDDKLLSSCAFNFSLRPYVKGQAAPAAPTASQGAAWWEKDQPRSASPRPASPRPAGARQAVRKKQPLETTAAAAGQGGY